jgi:hypothetical protein
MEEGFNAFHRAGQKLLRIRDERLYREEYGTFEAFCKTVLGHSKTYATNLIVGYELIQDLVALGVTVLPESERMARRLARYPKDMRKLIWQRAVQIEGRKRPTYKTLHQAATEIVPSKDVQEIWTGQCIENLRIARRKLTVSVDLHS